MKVEQVVARLAACTEPRGSLGRALVVGGWKVALRGLDAGLAGELDRRWGAFLEDASGGGEMQLRVELRRGGATPWVEPRPGETYRLEGAVARQGPAVWSYHFAAAAATDDPHRWIAAVGDSPAEPAERMVDNLTRYVLTRKAVVEGGFAMHAAGVLREGRAFVFAGKSGAGKTTAVSMSSPSPSLGDDFALVVPRVEGWVTAAVPFDNRERIDEAPPRGWVPLAGVWRLHQGREVRVERPPVARAGASLMGCTAFASAMPDLAPAIVAAVGRLAGDGLYHHLHFDESPAFWGPVRDSASSV